MREREVRDRIAADAARLIVEQGRSNAGDAVRKAADRLGVRDPRLLPDAADVDAALRLHQRLFRAESQPTRLRRLRKAAADAMDFFAAFEPRLVGPVLDGTADRHDDVVLQVFSDEPEAVQRHLEAHRIPFSSHLRKLRYRDGRQVACSAYRTSADGIGFELVVLPRDGLREAPTDPAAGTPMARAALGRVRALLAESS